MLKRKPFIVCLAALLFMTLAPLGTRVEAAQSFASPPLLKINEYAVLFTAPVAPFIDSAGRAQVPLRSVGDLLGAQVTYFPQGRSATIALNSHLLTVTLDSKQIRADGRSYTMDTVPMMRNNSVYIPIRVLIDRLQVSGTYRNGIIELQDRRYMRSIPPLLSDWSGRLAAYQISRSLDVRSYSLSWNADAVPSGRWAGKLQVTARNISRGTIDSDMQYFQPIMQYSDGSTQIGFESVHTPTDVPAGGLVSVTWNVSGTKPPQYVLLRNYV
ncbi:copper amine oxidase N-terminal domain-containing protein [Paenibacillus campi]|uniref:copper amine oxidase N-terminal domain-containing protein n=1 Tax=Paenibacillus campi TaxID=3106031 RepID=UPI002AFFE4FD|nr:MULTISPECIES: copper amine oxidase N-terminal domain-containing protein [unclassified Paenibacillus]